MVKAFVRRCAWGVGAAVVTFGAARGGGGGGGRRQVCVGSSKASIVGGCCGATPATPLARSTHSMRIASFGGSRNAGHTAGCAITAVGAPNGCLVARPACLGHLCARGDGGDHTHAPNYQGPLPRIHRHRTIYINPVYIHEDHVALQTTHSRVQTSKKWSNTREMPPKKEEKKAGDDSPE